MISPNLFRNAGVNNVFSLFSKLGAGGTYAPNWSRTAASNLMKRPSWGRGVQKASSYFGAGDFAGQGWQRGAVGAARSAPVAGLGYMALF